MNPKNKIKRAFDLEPRVKPAYAESSYACARRPAALSQAASYAASPLLRRDARRLQPDISTVWTGGFFDL